MAEERRRQEDRDLRVRAGRAPGEVQDETSAPGTGVPVPRLPLAAVGRPRL